jgi:D-sedoheptulose 7-phosphate isomerase
MSLDSIGTDVDSHLRHLSHALRHLHRNSDDLREWGAELALTLSRGGRLITAGNGGSAAEAQHLVGQLVGRHRADRRPLAALALTADSVVTTAAADDYGYRSVFARQIRAHARPGDVVLLMSASGPSVNLISAAEAATAARAHPWALTGPAPNPLALLTSRHYAVPVADPQVVQEVHQVVVHLLAGFVDDLIPFSVLDDSFVNSFADSLQGQIRDVPQILDQDPGRVADVARTRAQAEAYTES